MGKLIEFTENNVFDDFKLKSIEVFKVEIREEKGDEDIMRVDGVINCNYKQERYPAIKFIYFRGVLKFPELKMDPDTLDAVKEKIIDSCEDFFKINVAPKSKLEIFLDNESVTTAIYLLGVVIMVGFILKMAGKM